MDEEEWTHVRTQTIRREFLRVSSWLLPALWLQPAPSPPRWWRRGWRGNGRTQRTHHRGLRPRPRRPPRWRRSSLRANCPHLRTGCPQPARADPVDEIGTYGGEVRCLNVGESYSACEQPVPVRRRRAVVRRCVKIELNLVESYSSTKTLRRAPSTCARASSTLTVSRSRRRTSLLVGGFGPEQDAATGALLHHHEQKAMISR
jgi:hypothetical protein